MRHRIFIDGRTGTVGLELESRLAGREDLQLLTVTEQEHRILEKRLAVAASADVTVLCLPDGAARAFTAAAPATRILDASSAHRVTPGWIYGLPELATGQRERIRDARLVSNPGCYPTGIALLIRPLVDAGLLAPDTHLNIVAQSGYSGGGRELIGTYANAPAGALPGARPYSLTGEHKHLPEICAHSGLTAAPIFLPSVADYYRGMLIQIPLRKSAPFTSDGYENILDCWRSRYAREPCVRVLSVASDATLNEGYLAPDEIAFVDTVELMLFAGKNQAVLAARLDNLGKGAAGAAVQNLNLMLGLPEHMGLQTWQPRGSL